MTESSRDQATIARLLTDHGPLSKDDVLVRLRADGVADADTLVDETLNEMSSPAALLVDERWVWLPTLLAGRIFTHVVTAAEVAHDLLTDTADLGPVTELCEFDGYQQLADGSPIRVVVAEFDDDVLAERGIPVDVVPEVGVLLPAGTLAALGVGAGDLVGIRLTDVGLAVERVTSVGPGDDVAARLTALLAEDEPTFVGAAVYELCVADPELFAEPLPPITAVIADAGLVLDGESMAPPGFDFAQWRFEARAALMAERYDITLDDAFAVQSLVVLYDRISDALDTAVEDIGVHAEHIGVEDDSPELDADDVDLIADAGSALSSPLLAAILLAETLDGGGSPAALGLFAEALEPQVPRSAQMAFRWLRAHAHEQLGEVELAEREFLAAETMNTEWAPALLDLARFASDRGDAERGLALLRRAGAGAENPLPNLLEKHRATPRDGVGRNDACWCGSGRKYKKCHLGREELPLDERADWLYFKACQHVTTIRAWFALHDEVNEERTAYAETEDDAYNMLGDPLMLDAVLCEGGGFEDFLAKRGFLLPADEQLLASQWLLVERSVFEVQDVARGRSATVRDVRTGDVHEVHERLASRMPSPGQYVCTRVFPCGETLRFLGGLEPVPPQARDALIELLDNEPDPVDLVALLTVRLAPPLLVNTDGDPLTLCEAEVRVSPGIESLLDDAYERVGQAAEWIEYVVTDDLPRVSASLALVGDVLTVNTNSERRMDGTLTALAALDPFAMVLSDEREPVEELADLADHAPPGAMASDDPRLAEAQAEFIRHYETRWLDESIPALGGCTPREAADDPTRRPDLVRLLDSFPVIDDGSAMNVVRLRAALGLS